MPYIDFDNSKKNKSTSRFLVYYLEKENKEKTDEEKENFFDLDSEYDNPEDIIEQIDNNISKLGKEEQKYYSIHISPSKKELNHILSDKNKLKDYTLKLIDVYAKNFNKNLDKSDILFFAKIEHHRAWKNLDSNTKLSFVKQGELKSGNNTHIHLIISRKTSSKWYKGQKIIDSKGNFLVNDKELIRRANTLKISPNDNARGGNQFKLSGRNIKRGFDRVNFKIKGEELFDRMFSYERGIEETFMYNNLKKNHLDLFIEKYGKQKVIEIENDIEYKSISNLKETERYIQKIINERVAFYENDKIGFDKCLKENGVNVFSNGFRLKKHFIEPQKIIKGLNKSAEAIFLTMYISNRIKEASKNIEKEQDKEKQ